MKMKANNRKLKSRRKNRNEKNKHLTRSTTTTKSYITKTNSTLPHRRQQQQLKQISHDKQFEIIICSSNKQKENVMPQKKLKKYYAVARGIYPGIYDEMNHVRKMTAGYPGSFYKVFYDETKARNWLNEQQQKSHNNTTTTTTASTKDSKALTKSTPTDKSKHQETSNINNNNPNPVSEDLLVQGYDNDGNIVSYAVESATVIDGKVQLSIKQNETFSPTSKINEKDVGTIRDIISFPPYERLPIRKDYDPLYYIRLPSSSSSTSTSSELDKSKENESYALRRHWAFFAEVKTVSPDGTMLFLIVTDRYGEDIMFSFKDVSRSMIEEGLGVKEGGCVCCVYFEKGEFDLDVMGKEKGMPPIAVVGRKDVEYMKVFDMDMEEVAAMYDEYGILMKRRDVCTGCLEKSGDSGKNLRTCPLCNVVQYCSAKCQKHSWSQGNHKEMCGKLKQVSFFYGVDWMKAEDGMPMGIINKDLGSLFGKMWKGDDS